jgi:signal transduction histidine kinase
LLRNFKLTILAFYVITVMLMVVAHFYAITVLKIEDVYWLLAAAWLMTMIFGFIIAKMAIEPLQEHFVHLERFSKETLHELNLPVNTILANTKMLKKKHAGDEKDLKRIERIEAASQMLQERYTELDYLIRTQMQREVVEEFDLAELLRQRVGFMEPIYPQLEFSLDLEPTMLNMDKIGLRKVIDNLIDNAAKYSDAKGKLHLRLNNRILEIEDHGRGIDEVELLRIFDRYYQSDATMPGYGIGLGLVKSFCDTHKVMLHVRSKVGQGTTMILDFKGVE